MIERITVSGEPVRLIALPRFTRKAVAAWEAFTRSDTIFGLDVESDTGDEGMGTYSPSVHMRLIQFGNGYEAWAFDPTDLRWRKRIEALLRDESKRFVSHNASFDTTRVWFEFGIRLGDRSIDTLVMAALLWPGQTIMGGKGLKNLCDHFIDSQLSEADELREARFTDLFYGMKPRKTRLLPVSFVPGESVCRRPKGKGEKCENPSYENSMVGYCYDHWLTRKGTKESEAWGWKNIALDDPLYTRYAGMDAVYVRRLLDILNVRLRAAHMTALGRTEQRVKRQMTGVSVKGHRVDAEWTEPILHEVEVEFADAEDAVEQLTGGIKARSPKMKDWFADHDVRVTSLDKDHLPLLLETYGPMGEVDRGEDVAEVLGQLLVVSKNSNLLTNLRTIWRHATEGDGFVHPNINTMQAHTGRMSVTDPAMQTLAKKGEKGHRLRGCFIAREGHVFVGADYDSQETRLAAGYSRDATLLRVVMEGLNQHDLTAAGLYEDYTNKAEMPDQYAKSKVLNYAQQYGAMPRKIAATLGITVKEATELWKKWRRTYAGLVEWSDAQARKDSVRNVYGRLIPRDPFRDYASGNYVIQSTGRDILGAALCRLEDEGWAPYFWLPLHDEMVLEVPEDRADEGAQALTDLMSTEVLGISMPAEGEVIGTRWRGL
jgi:DNA polymerase I